MLNGSLAHLRAQGDPQPVGNQGLVELGAVIRDPPPCLPLSHRRGVYRLSANRSVSADRSHWTREGWAAHRRELNRQLRAAFLAGAEGRSRAERGRGLTDAEVRRLSWDY